MRHATEIGRRARLELVFAYRRGRTVLAHAYAEPPWRVGRLHDAGGIAHLILVCAGPGVFAGDHLEQHVRVESGARVLLVSQSALQVRPAASGRPACLDASYTIEEGGLLDGVFDPLIPFAGARLRQRIDLQVDPGAQLFWSDALMSGRAGSGEAWRFETLDHELRLSVGGRLQYLDRSVVSPRSVDPTHPWRAGGANYLGTAILHADTADAVRAESAQHRLEAIAGLRAGVDCLAPHLVVARLLAERGPQFAAGRALLRETFERPVPRR